MFIYRAKYLLLIIFFIACAKDKPLTSPTLTPLGKYTGSYLCKKTTSSSGNGSPPSSNTQSGLTYEVLHFGDSVLFNGTLFPIDSAGGYSKFVGDIISGTTTSLFLNVDSIFYYQSYFSDMPGAPSPSGNSTRIEGAKQ